MDTNVTQRTAKIYQFPVQNRRTVSNVPQDANTPPRGIARVVEIESGSGWYHQHAIVQAERPRKN